MRSTPYLPQARVSLSVSDPDGDESVAPSDFEVADIENIFSIALCILAATGRHSAECQCSTTSHGPSSYNHIPRCKAPYFSTARLRGSVLADY